MPTKENIFIELRWLIVSVLLSAAILTGMYYCRAELDSQINAAETETSKYVAAINQSKEMERQMHERLKTTAAPAQVAEIDSIQNKLLERMKLNGINIQSLTRVPAPPMTGKDSPPPNGIEFDMTISGNWEAVMGFLDSMQKDTVLINLRQILMEPVSDTNLIKTICRYKIYTE